MYTNIVYCVYVLSAYVKCIKPCQTETLASDWSVASDQALSLVSSLSGHNRGITSQCGHISESGANYCSIALSATRWTFSMVSIALLAIRQARVILFRNEYLELYHL